MKKLIFNIITKEIIIKEEKQKEKKIIQVKIFFEEYKIFFEIFSSVLLGIMSLIISFVGWQTNERSVDLYQKQLEMQQAQSEIQQVQSEIQQAQLEIQQAQLEMQQAQSEIYQKQLEMQINDREPHFTISCEPINENDYSSKINYIIKNEGGKINLGSIWYIDAFLTIYFAGNDYNTYYCQINGAFFLEDRDWDLSLYNNNEFKFYGYDYSLYYQLRDDLQTELNSIYGRENIIVSFNSYLTMHFTNYKNEYYKNTYIFESHNMEYVNNDYNEGKIYLNSFDYGADISSIAYEITEKIDEFENGINF